MAYSKVTSHEQDSYFYDTAKITKWHVCNTPFGNKKNKKSLRHCEEVTPFLGHSRCERVLIGRPVNTSANQGPPVLSPS